MRILYAIQGTGNGHLARAKELVPLLKQKADITVLISGMQSDLKVDFDVDFRFHGMGFIFGKKGGVDFLKTFRKCLTRKFLSEVQSLPVEDYDLIINDFEPVSAWAARIKGIPCVSLSHQYAVLHSNAPKPYKKDWMGNMILTFYAPVQKGYGFHFQPYSPSIFTPVIRQEVRNLRIKTGDYITVYLPAYDNERIIKVLSQFDSENWQVFSKHCHKTIRYKNIEIQPIENKRFLHSMAGSKAVLCGAGFETPAEALFLGKSLMVIPMKNQYEQQCNAAALQKMGIQTIKSLKKKYSPQIGEWLQNGMPIRVSYPDQSSQIITRILEDALTLPRPKPMKALAMF